MNAEPKATELNNNGRFEVTTTSGKQSLIQYSQKEIGLIKKMYAEKATDEEFMLLMHMSKEYALNILTRQIWIIKYGKKAATIFVGRDGFLELAYRTGQFNGMETSVVKIDEGFSVDYLETVWETDKQGRNVSKKVKKTFKSDFQYVATCKLYRKDFDHPIVVTVYEEEYSSGRDNWLLKRRTMIGKVSESQGLRKIANVSGVYSPEERERETITPDYEIEPDLVFPKRSEINQKLLKLTDKEEFAIIKDEFTQELGQDSLLCKNGHKDETWEQLFKTHENRLDKVNPITGKKPWIDRVNECETIEVFYVLQEELDDNESLQKDDNYIILSQRKSELGITEND